MKTPRLQVRVTLGARTFLATISLGDLVTHGDEGLLTNKQLREEIELCALGHVVDRIKVKPVRGEVSRLIREIKEADS